MFIHVFPAPSRVCQRGVYDERFGGVGKDAHSQARRSPLCRKATMLPSGARTTSVASTVTSTSCRQEPAPEPDGDAGRHPDAQDGIVSVSTPVAPPQQRTSAAHESGRRQAGPAPQGGLIVVASRCARRARCVPSSYSLCCASLWADPAAPMHRRRRTPCRLPALSRRQGGLG